MLENNNSSCIGNGEEEANLWTEANRVGKSAAIQDVLQKLNLLQRQQMHFYIRL